MFISHPRPTTRAQSRAPRSPASAVFFGRGYRTVALDFASTIPDSPAIESQ